MSEEPTKKRLLSRRQTLGLIGGAGIAIVTGCGDDDEPSTSPSATASRSSGPAATAPASAAAANPTPAPVACVITAEQTEGPYFVDERLNRADIRPDPSDGSLKEGVPLRLGLTVSEVNGAACTPLVGALVDVWHCDALGAYSDVSGGPGQADTTGQKFLRGYQLTGADGRVEFQTIYPGWYSGRTVHIHFKVRTDPDSASGFEFTSQLFFDESITNAVVTRSPYSDKGSPDTTNSSDNIFDAMLMLPVAVEDDGYGGDFHVGVNMA